MCRMSFRRFWAALVCCQAYVPRYCPLNPKLLLPGLPIRDGDDLHGRLKNSVDLERISDMFLNEIYRGLQEKPFASFWVGPYCPTTHDQASKSHLFKNAAHDLKVTLHGPATSPKFKPTGRATERTSGFPGGLEHLPEPLCV